MKKRKELYIQGNSIKLCHTFQKISTYLEKLEDALFDEDMERLEDFIIKLVILDYEFTVGKMIHKVFVFDDRRKLINNPDYITLSLYKNYGNNSIYSVVEV